jgi:glycosyltransferase involved in cell wall biosynthesis
MNWVLITGEYPPARGGVADYTALLAEALDQTGESVHVIAPRTEGVAAQRGNVVFHPLPAKYDLRSIALLDRTIRTIPQPRRLVVQYVAQAFGWRAMNLPFCFWVRSVRTRETIWTMFHEVAMPVRRDNTWRRNVLGAVTSLMARLIVHSSQRMFISTLAWRPWLASLGADHDRVFALAVPSNIPESVEPVDVLALRRRLTRDEPALLIGHFGTYTPHTLPVLYPLLAPLIASHPNRILVLLGKRGDTFADSLMDVDPRLKGRVCAPGYLSPGDVATHLSCCDLLVQPFADGVTTRRTTVMAGLALGLPILTNAGQFTETIWRDTGAVELCPTCDPNEMVHLANGLLNDPPRRRDLGRRARRLYLSSFSMHCAIEQLLCEQRADTTAA